LDCNGLVCGVEYCDAEIEVAGCYLKDIK